MDEEERHPPASMIGTGVSLHEAEREVHRPAENEVAAGRERVISQRGKPDRGDDRLQSGQVL